MARCEEVTKVSIDLAGIASVPQSATGSAVTFGARSRPGSTSHWSANVFSRFLSRVVCVMSRHLTLVVVDEVPVEDRFLFLFIVRLRLKGYYIALS